ncbi:MAG TPA: DUF1501 domain-containing protein [Gemmataceae bacterium]|nr:DUF1501 domain-containing protein [Gemmataceae bacterium]
MLARAAEAPAERGRPAQSIIMLWLQGGPSQLETFDPHPGTAIAGGTTAIRTAMKGVQLATGLERTAAELGSIALVRSMVSKEGDHERGTYTMKTGFRPDPTIIHPSIGAVCCHELPVAGTDIPRHVSILPGQWPARGGFLGESHDAFKTGDPAGEVPDTVSHLAREREEKRLKHLDVVESAFARGRRGRVEATRHAETVARARKMMSSEQLKAFDVSREPLALRRAYGDTPFGRGCLAARRLIEVGVRCVEVTLDGWDTHANNHALHRQRLTILDPAYSTLLRDLRERGLLERTVVLCTGEFGRTPSINPLGGRDHWPNGFSLALAGGGIRGGQVIGETDPEGKKTPTKPVSVGDLHATILTAVGIDPKKVNQTPIGRTVRFAEGTPIAGLLEKKS